MEAHKAQRWRVGICSRGRERRSSEEGRNNVLKTGPDRPVEPVQPETVKTQPPSPTHTKHPFLRTSKQLALRFPRRPDPKPNFVAGTAAAVRGCLRLRGLLLPLSQRHTARVSLLARRVIHSAGEVAVRGFQLLRRRLAVDVLLWWKCFRHEGKDENYFYSQAHFSELYISGKSIWELCCIQGSRD
ncbi:uncharacterized protein [Arachis hypogaea]|uniref:uncharacterized protein n=1 Tax=Arachis hypogaea TaxID=3818 RepID=UPI003B21AB0C